MNSMNQKNQMPDRTLGGINNTYLQVGVIVLMIILVVASYIFGINAYSARAKTALSEFSQRVKKVERAFLEGVSLFEDAVTPARLAQARRHLNEAHLGEIRKNKWVAVKDDDQLQSMIQEGELVNLQNDDPANLYYFYNIPAKYRYLRPAGVQKLDLILKRFQQNLPQVEGVDYRVKLALSSALRPEEYQSDLQKQNSNAANESSHRYGASFDIFYGDFYISFDSAAHPAGDPNLPQSMTQLIEEIRPQVGFLAGDALKGQLQTILFETLVELQSQGEIFIIYEKTQKCYHITARTSG